MANRKYTSLPYTEYTVAYGRYDESRAKIDRIVIHTMVGTMQSTRNLFANAPAPGKETSAHYGISYEGALDAYLEEYYTAYHCGNYGFNQRSIGIEHEDKGQAFSPRPDALYEASALLVADICKFYSIPCNRTNIVKHNEVPGSSTACPGTLDIDRIVNRAAQILGGSPTPPVGGCPDNITRKSSYFDVLAHDEWGTNTDTDKIDQAKFNQFRSDLKVRRTGNGNWDTVKNAAGLPNTQDVNAVINALRAQGASSVSIEAEKKKAYNSAIADAKKISKKADEDIGKLKKS